MASGERLRLRATAGSAVLRMVASSACIKKAAAAMAGSPTSLCKEKVITHAALSSPFALWASDGSEICSLSFVSLLHSEKRCCLQAVPGGSVAPSYRFRSPSGGGWCLGNAPLFPVNPGMARSRSTVRRRGGRPFGVRQTAPHSIGCIRWVKMLSRRENQ